MTSMALNTYNDATEMRTYRRRSPSQAQAYRALPVRATVIDLREADPKSSKLARILMRPLVLGMMLTVAWQVGLAIGQLH